MARFERHLFYTAPPSREQPPCWLEGASAWEEGPMALSRATTRRRQNASDGCVPVSRHCGRHRNERRCSALLRNLRRVESTRYASGTGRARADTRGPRTCPGGEEPRVGPGRRSWAIRNCPRRARPHRVSCRPLRGLAAGCKGEDRPGGRGRSVENCIESCGP